MKTTWQIPKKAYPKLGADLNVDVAIIGGGLSGIQSAYFLSKAGLKAAVLEKETIGSGASLYTTAFITFVIDTALTDLISMFGVASARQVWDSGQMAINSIEQVILNEGIDCEFLRTPLNIYANSEKEFKNLHEESRTAARLGYKTSLKLRDDLGFKNSGYWQIGQQAKFHPLKYLFALAEKAQNTGALIFENSEVKEIKNGKAVLEKHSVKADFIINAAYDPLGNPKATHFKKGMYASYVLEYELPKKAMPEGLYLDMQNPYHYFRMDSYKDYDRLLLGGEDHREEIKMNPEKNYSALKKYLSDILPGMNAKMVRKWTGPVLEPSDGLPLIGLAENRHLVATGFSGNGMTYSMIAAKMFTDIITGKKNPFRQLYDPARKVKFKAIAKKAADYGKEFFRGAAKNIIRY